MQIFEKTILFLIFVDFLEANNGAKRLFDDLLINYNRHRRPSNSPTEATTIKLKLRLSQIIDVVGFFISKVKKKIIVIINYVTKNFFRVT